MLCAWLMRSRGWNGLACSWLLLAGCGTEVTGEEESLGTVQQALCAQQLLPRVAAFASTVENVRYPASAAIDGSLSTRWSSVYADPQWLVVDLGEVRHISRVVLRWEKAASRHYRLEVSDSPDGPWTWIHEDGRGSGGNVAVNGLEATGRYLRVYSLSRTSGFGVSLFEVEAYGDTDPTCLGGAPEPPLPCASEKLVNLSATASSSEGRNYPAGEAVDGIIQSGCGVENRWASAYSDPQWLQVRLQGLTHIDRVVLHWECAASANYEIQVASNAEGPWATVYSDTAANGGRDDITGLNATGHFVRVLSRARRTAFGNSLYEVEVFGDTSWNCGAQSCVNPDAANSTTLSLHEPGIGARYGTTTTPRGAVRIAQNPVSKKVYVLLGDGSLRELSLTTLTTAPAVAGNAILSELPTGTFLTSVQGFAFGPEGNVYLVANEDHGATNVGLVVKGTANATATSWTWSILARSAEYPDSGSSFDHHWNGVVVSPDGKDVYVASGSRTDHGEVQDAGGAYPNLREIPLTSRIFRLPSSGAGISLPNDDAGLASYDFARGIRNTFDFAFAPDGKLLGVDNGPDADYSEELNWLRLGRHYGFPWRLGAEDNAMQFASYDPALDQRLRPGYAGTEFYYNDPAFPPKPPQLVDPIANRGPDGDLFRNPQTGAIEDASALGRTLGTFTGHRSPLGLSFDVEGRLCGSLKRSGLMLSFGAAVPATPANGMLPDQGRDLLALEVLPAGESFQIRTRKLVSGFARPVDSVLIGNKLYVLEYGGTSRVYEISLPMPG
ncbi:MAG: cytochrome c class [Polyangiaceae bacterium]|nr:cytochrome c class [Polyangiaceae bacterium]